MAADELLQVGDACLLGIALVGVLEEERQTLQGSLLLEGQQGRTQWMLTAEFRLRAFSGEELADHLRLKGCGKGTSGTSWHGRNSLGASIHIVLVSPKGRITRRYKHAAA